MKTLRSIGAVLAGLVVIVVLSTATDAMLHATGIYPPLGQPMAGGLFLLALGYRLVYGIAGCFVAARLAPRPEFGPKWYAIAVAATALPCAWAGGRLGEGR